MDEIEDTMSSERLMDFVKDLSFYEFESEVDYQKRYNEMKVKYKLCPSKPQLRKVYNELSVTNMVDENPSFLEYTLKRKCRSGSGVTVITILTSPTPDIPIRTEKR